MTHLHRTMALVMVWFCIPHLSVAQHKVVADTTVCSAIMDSVKLYSYRYDANDSLRYFAQKLLTCSEEIADVDGQLEALSVLGITCIRENNYDEALAFFERNQKLAVKVGNRKVEAQVLINVASVYTSLDSSKRAMEMLMHSAKIFEEEGDSAMLVYTYTNIGILFGKIKERKEQLAIVERRSPWEVGLSRAEGP